MQRVHRARPLLAMGLLVGASVPAGCGSGSAGAPSPYVAEFALGEDSVAARSFQLMEPAAPPLQVVPEPSAAPLIVPTPDLGAPEPAPTSVGWPSFAPSVAWVNDGQYLGVVTFGSGSCPSGPHALSVAGDQEIEVRLGPLFPDREVCPAAVRGHVRGVGLPGGITPDEPLLARFEEREVTIPAAHP